MRTECHWTPGPPRRVALMWRAAVLTLFVVGLVAGPRPRAPWWSRTSSPGRAGSAIAPDGTLYATLVGTGGRRCNFEGCFGASGSIVRVTPGGAVKTVADGLLSMRGRPDGFFSLGADQLTVLPDGRLMTAISAEFNEAPNTPPRQVPKAVRTQSGRLVFVTPGERRENRAERLGGRVSRRPRRRGEGLQPVRRRGAGRRALRLGLGGQRAARDPRERRSRDRGVPAHRGGRAVGPRGADGGDGRRALRRRVHGQRVKGPQRAHLAGRAGRGAGALRLGADHDQRARDRAGRRPLRDRVPSRAGDPDRARRHRSTTVATGLHYPGGVAGRQGRQGLRQRLVGRGRHPRGRLSQAHRPYPAPDLSAEHVDVLIVGAGLSGIGAAYHLQTGCPRKTYAILEARDAIGGTWDLFRYPGIRSDSDMYTLGYPFRPWTSAKAIADGPSILEYVRDTAREAGIDRTHPLRPPRRARRRGRRADARWTVARPRAASRTSRARFLFVCAGYYDYDEGYRPDVRRASSDFDGPARPPAVLARGPRLRGQARRRDRQRRDRGHARARARGARPRT